MNPRTITGALFVVVIALQLISFYAVSKLEQTRLHEQVQLLSVHEMQNKAKSLLIQAQQFLTPIPSQLSISRQLIGDGLLDAADSKTLESYFVSQLRSNLAMNAMYLGRSDGSYVAVGRFEQSLLKDYHKPVLRARVVALTDEMTVRISWREYSLLGDELRTWGDVSDALDPRVLEWHEYARTYDNPVWTNAFSMNNSDRRAIAASVNLRDSNGQDAGVLGVSVDLAQLSAMVSNIPMNKMTTAYIVDNEHNLIAASVPTSPQVQAMESGSTSGSFRSRLPVTQMIPQLLPPVDVSGNRLSAVDRHWFSEDGAQVHVQRRIQLFDGALQWRVILKTPVSVIGDMHKGMIQAPMNYLLSIIVLPGMIAIFLIVSLIKPLSLLHRRATVDFLTRAFNREEFSNRFDKGLAKTRQAQDAQTRWVGVALDLDGFKQINDQYGHDAGDQILKTVVVRLRQIVGRSGFIGRLGGDEFAIALKIKPSDDANAVVESIRAAVVKDPIKSRTAVHQIGMTAGIAEVDSRSDESVVEILEQADRALIAGKVVAKNATYSAESLASHNRRVVVALHPQEKPTLPALTYVNG